MNSTLLLLYTLKYFFNSYLKDKSNLSMTFLLGEGI